MALGFLATKARSDVLTLSPPADLVPLLVDALEHLRSGASGERRAEHELLAGAIAGGGAVSARRDLLSELLAVAIDEAGERVAGASSRLLRGEGEVAEARVALERLGRLLDLHESVAG